MPCLYETKRTIHDNSLTPQGERSCFYFVETHCHASQSRRIHPAEDGTPQEGNPEENYSISSKIPTEIPFSSIKPRCIPGVVYSKVISPIGVIPMMPPVPPIPRI